jgi:anti-sigma factor RsiW
MSISQNRLSQDREVLSYLDALDAGDLEEIAAAWERASADPVLAALLGEVDQELAAESGSLVRGKFESAVSSSLRRTRETNRSNPRLWRRRLGVACALAAACFLALLAWKAFPGKTASDGDYISPLDLASKPLNEDAVAALPMGTRLNKQATLTHFTWPVEEHTPIRVGSSIPPDLLN